MRERCQVCGVELTAHQQHGYCDSDRCNPAADRGGKGMSSWDEEDRLTKRYVESVNAETRRLPMNKRVVTVVVLDPFADDKVGSMKLRSFEDPSNAQNYADAVMEADGSTAVVVENPYFPTYLEQRQDGVQVSTSGNQEFIDALDEYTALVRNVVAEENTLSEMLEQVAKVRARLIELEAQER